MLSLRAHALICAGLFGAIILLAIIGNAVQAAGIVKDPTTMQVPMAVIFSLLAFALMLSAVPLMVKLVLGFQKHIGNQDVAAVKAALAHEKHIVWAIWGLIIAGSAIAIPAAVLDWTSTTKLTVEAPTPSEGTLIAAPGMLVADMARQSTLKLQRNADLPEQNINPLPMAGGANFDFEIAGTGFVIPNCKYYFVSTYTHDPKRIEAINVGTSPHKVSRAELEQANSSLQARLAVAGWLTGHEEYRDEQDRTLHGGAARGPEGSLWLKHDVVLDIETRRMDDEVQGEDKATAGEWIQFVEVWPRADYPGIERLVFAPPTHAISQ